MKKLFLAAETDLESLDQVMVIRADNEEEARQFAIHKWSETNSKMDYFREFVNEGKDCPAFSINEKLLQDEDGNYNPDIDNKQYLANVNELFKFNPMYGMHYLDYVNGDYPPNFSDDFFEYVCSRLCEMGEWCSFDVREL
ncbi:hypothetical protein [Virgibacillus halodenitrificans]|uniref:Uncharacterized protein n=1 Tax=Virgibacillus halodenitrificans TaxID=1482 RepID=A0ABR7VLH7_VIRHA|nr:hypothetical protein [Virgibacillus halodenitrificans]MBD1222777.1 hypothetical protein [Virgibacillus halodenitrificans]